MDGRSERQSSTGSVRFPPPWLRWCRSPRLASSGFRGQRCALRSRPDSVEEIGTGSKECARRSNQSITQSIEQVKAQQVTIIRANWVFVVYWGCRYATND